MNFERTGLALAATLMILLAGCYGGSEKNSVDQARAALDKGDTKSASIHLKNALQDHPESAQARFLFGKLLLASGDLRAAEIELRKAQELKHPINEVAPALASILSARREFAQVISEYGTLTLSDPARQADLSAIVAGAYAKTGQRAKAAELVESALARAPDNISIRLVQARLLAGGGDVDSALKVVDQTLAKSPSEVDALRLKGDLVLYGKRNRRQALTAYLGVLNLRPDDLTALAQVISIFIAEKDLKAAQEHLTAMIKAAPNHPLTKMQAATVSFHGGDYSRTRELVAPMMRSANSDLDALLLAAATELQLNSLLQAETYLNKIMLLSPDSPGARRMLATIFLRRGDANKALDALLPLLDSKTFDVEALSLAAEAHLQSGDATKAEEFFARVLRIKPDDVQIRTALALVHMSGANAPTAMAELQSIAAGDTGTIADMALINARIRQGDTDGALTAIDALDRKLPKKALGPDLRGHVYILKRDSTKARQAFEDALSRDPVYFPSVASLARFDAADGRPDQAQQRFEALLKADPKNIRAYLALAGLKARASSNRDEVAQLLSQAIAVNPSDPSVHVLLVDHWLKNGSPKRALEAAQAGLAGNQDEPLLLDALGRAQLANNEVAQALATFAKVSAKQPKSAIAQLRLAKAYRYANNTTGEEQALRRALEIAPDLLVAQRDLASLAVQTKQPEKALAIARGTQRQFPKDAIGHLIEGDIHVAFKDWDSAAKAYRAGLQKQRAGVSAVRLYALLGKTGRKAEADRFADEWLKQSPKDTALRIYLGQQAMLADDLAKAERLYTEVVSLEPLNLTALNDLAWVLAKSKRAGGVAMAERALALAPENPNTLDTLAFALAEENQLPRAVEAARSATRLAPENPEFRLGLAKIFLRANDKKNAKMQLDELSKLGPKFAKQREVDELIRSL